MMDDNSHTNAISIAMRLVLARHGTKTRDTNYLYRSAAQRGLIISILSGQGTFVRENVCKKLERHPGVACAAMTDRGYATHPSPGTAGRDRGAGGGRGTASSADGLGLMTSFMSLLYRDTLAMDPHLSTAYLITSRYS